MKLDQSNIQAIILVGGKGTRLKNLISDRPKPMAEVMGKPFLEWIIVALRKQGIHKIILAVSHLKEIIKDYFQDGALLNVNISYSEELSPLNTGGAILHALEKVNGNHFFVLNGDSYCAWDLHSLVEKQKTSKSLVTLSLIRKSNVERYGTVVIDKKGEVLCFKEKVENPKKGGWINSGIYFFDKDCFTLSPFRGNFSLEKDFLPFWVRKNRVYSVINNTNIFLDIGIPDDYLKAEKLLKKEFKTFI